MGYVRQKAGHFDGITVYAAKASVYASISETAEQEGRTQCCGAMQTFHDDIRCCKRCWIEVDLDGSLL